MIEAIDKFDLTTDGIISKIRIYNSHIGVKADLTLSYGRKKTVDWEETNFQCAYRKAITPHTIFRDERMPEGRKSYLDVLRCGEKEEVIEVLKKYAERFSKCDNPEFMTSLFLSEEVDKDTPAVLDRVDAFQ